MTFQPSRWVASIGFLALVPGAIALAYLGRDWGWYPTIAIPVVFGATLLVGLVVLFAALPVLRRWERTRSGDVGR